MPTGTADPERRDRIAEAVLTIVAKEGADRITHRAVASEAGVPLGSTTYYFSSREALLAAALDKAKLAWDEELAGWESTVADEADLPRSLAELTVRLTGPLRHQAIVGQELYTASLRSPSMRPVGFEWGQALSTMLQHHTDAVTAESLAMCFDGLVVRSLLREHPFSKAEAAPIFERIICR